MVDFVTDIERLTYKEL